MAGAFIGTAIADAFLGDEPGDDAMPAEDTASEDPGGGLGDPGMGDFGGMDGGFDV